MDIPISAKAALLQVLLEGPGYGTELMSRIETRTKGAITLLQGSLYPALKRLEEDGLVSGEEGEQRGAMNYKMTYSLTPKGKALALNHRATLVGIVRATPKRRRSKTDASPPEEMTVLEMLAAPVVQD